MVAAFAYIASGRIGDGLVKPSVASVDVIHDGRRTSDPETATLQAAAATENVPLAVGSLFGYGTLLRGECNYSALASDGGVEITSMATAMGGLVDLGAYPAMVRAADRRVHGEVVRVRDLEAVLRRLDRFDGFYGYDSSSLCYRVLTRVDVADEDSCDAWTYIFSESVKTNPVISSGNWRTHVGRSQG